MGGVRKHGPGPTAPDPGGPAARDPGHYCALGQRAVMQPRHEKAVQTGMHDPVREQVMGSMVDRRKNHDPWWITSHASVVDRRGLHTKNHGARKSFARSSSQEGSRHDRTAGNGASMIKHDRMAQEALWGRSNGQKGC